MNIHRQTAPERLEMMNRPVQTASIKAVFLVSLFAFMLAMPSLMNGKPFIFFDSLQYYDVGKSIVTKLESALLAQTNTSGPVDEILVESSPEDEMTVLEPASIDQETGGLAAIAGGRSPIYSVVTYIVSENFSSFAIVLIQCLTMAWLLFRFLSLMVPETSAMAKLALVACLSAFTPLGFHSGFVMPDIFAGIFLLGALIMIFDHALNRLDTLLLVVILTIAATMHTTILPIGAVVVGLSLAIRMLVSTRASINGSATIWISGTLLFSLVLTNTYEIGVARVTGDKLASAPYLMARVIADGPGERLLETSCDEPVFAACVFRGVDFENHNDFLWGTDGATLNFSTVDLATKHALQAEETSFVLAAALAFPAQQFNAALRNGTTQLIYVGISEVNLGAERLMQDPVQASHPFMRQVPGLEKCAKGTSGCEPNSVLRKTWDLFIRAFTLTSIGALLAFLAFNASSLLTGRDAASPEHNRIVIAAVILIIVLVANAAVCGVLSGPHDRYQARLAWVAALILGAAYLHFRHRRRDGLNL